MDVYPILSRLVAPTELHGMTDAELQQVANEVRQAILDQVSQTGGHFSSNLGTVELTVALYATHSRRTWWCGIPATRRTPTSC